MRCKRVKEAIFKKTSKKNQLNKSFNEKLEIPNKNDFIVIFIWHEALDDYNKHTFETYHIWKENDNIKFYFLESTHKQSTIYKIVYRFIIQNLPVKFKYGISKNIIIWCWHF